MSKQEEKVNILKSFGIFYVCNGRPVIGHSYAQKPGTWCRSLGHANVLLRAGRCKHKKFQNFSEYSIFALESLVLRRTLSAVSRRGIASRSPGHGRERREGRYIQIGTVALRQYATARRGGGAGGRRYTAAIDCGASSRWSASCRGRSHWQQEGGGAAGRPGRGVQPESASVARRARLPPVARIRPRHGE